MKKYLLIVLFGTLALSACGGSGLLTRDAPARAPTPVVAPIGAQGTASCGVSAPDHVFFGDGTYGCFDGAANTAFDYAYSSQRDAYYIYNTSGTRYTTPAEAMAVANARYSLAGRWESRSISSTNNDSGSLSGRLDANFITGNATLSLNTRGVGGTTSLVRNSANTAEYTFHLNDPDSKMLVRFNGSGADRVVGVGRDVFDDDNGVLVTLDYAFSGDKE